MPWQMNCMRWDLGQTTFLRSRAIGPANSPCGPPQVKTYGRGVLRFLAGREPVLDLDAGRAAFKDRHTDLTETEGKDS